VWTRPPIRTIAGTAESRARAAPYARRGRVGPCARAARACAVSRA
jgi:hypothetical protein